MRKLHRTKRPDRLQEIQVHLAKEWTFSLQNLLTQLNKKSPPNNTNLKNIYNIEIEQFSMFKEAQELSYYISIFTHIFTHIQFHKITIILLEIFYQIGSRTSKLNKVFSILVFLLLFLFKGLLWKY